MELENTNKRLQESKEIFNGILQDIGKDETEKKRIEERIEEILKRNKIIEEEVKELTFKKECLRVLLDEIDIGFEKILASSQCLSILASRKLRKLKRIYMRYLR